MWYKQIIDDFFYYQRIDNSRISYNIINEGKKMY